MLQLQQVIGGRQLAFAPQALQKFCATVYVGAATAAPAGPGRPCGSETFGGATLFGLDFDPHARRFGGSDVGIGLGRDDFGTELELTAAFCVLLDDLHPLAGFLEFPVVLVGVGVEITQGIHAGIVALEHFPDQVAGEIEVACAR